ncbi:hypothetical protein FOZ63_010574 [Perkinsus olseni]|nr:hypothetical protein FOZ63_010574 [Perkinsus olseni]
MYLGELTRLACLDVLKDYSPGKQLPDFLTKGPLDSKFVCAALEEDGFECDDEVVRIVFRTIGDAVVERSANLCAAGLAAVAEKCGIGRENKRHMREVCVDHGMPRCLTIGVDGSLYLKGYHYPERLAMAFSKIVGDVMASLIHTVHSSDGSGVGAALMAAAVSQ